MGTGKQVVRTYNVPKERPIQIKLPTKTTKETVKVGTK